MLVSALILFGMRRVAGVKSLAIGLKDACASSSSISEGEEATDTRGQQVRETEKRNKEREEKKQTLFRRARMAKQTGPFD